MSACRPWIIMYKNISKSTYFNLWMSQLSQFLPMGYFFFSQQPRLGPNLSPLRLTRTHYLLCILEIITSLEGLERGFSGYQHLFLFQKTWDLFPTTTWQHQPPEMQLQVQGNQIPFLDFLCTRHAHDTRI